MIPSPVQGTFVWAESKVETSWSPLSVLLFPTTDRILQTGQSRGVLEEA